MTRAPWLALSCLLASCTLVHDVTLGADERKATAPDGGRTPPDDDDRDDEPAGADAGRSMTTSDGSIGDTDARIGLADASAYDSATTDAGSSEGGADGGSPGAGNSFDAGVIDIADSDDLQDAGQEHGDELRHR